MKFFGLIIATLLPIHFGFGQTTDVLPAEISPGVPKTEMMAEWLKQQAMVALDRREAAFENLKIDEDLKQWQDERRAFFVRQLGGFPERTPLNPKVTGKLSVDDYRIEKLYFESQPGFHVTATLYLPLGEGPFPAVLHPTGHSASAKNRELYQQASIVIVKGGCAVLCYDPIGQGERQQVYGPDGKPIASTMQHSLIDQGAHLLGSSTAQIMIWDGMRAIDYLQSRPDIIADNIGCTGISGGGTNTSYLMALDDRIVAAAPGCYLTGFRSLLNTIGPQDAEQNIHGQITFGMDHSDYVLMHLPRPTLIMAATGDYFDIRGAWNLFREGKRFATHLGHPERISLVEPNTGHGFPTEMRVASANWMRRWLLGLDQPISEGELTPLPEEELNATPHGKVLELEGARSAFDLNSATNQRFAARRAENAKPENRDALLSKIRQLIGARNLADLPEPKLTKVGQIRLIIEPEPGIQLPGHLYQTADSKTTKTLTIVLFGEGARAAIESGETEKIIKATQAPVLAIDLRGLGETKRKVEKPRIGDQLVGVDRKDTWLANLLGKTYVGLRAEDIWQIVRALRKELGNETLKPHLLAYGEAGIPALHAAALEPDLFGDVTISNAIKSWTAVVETPLVKNQQPNLVFGALREYDLPMLRKMLGDKLKFTNPANPDGTLAISPQ
ncbi:MAG: acetylxylan esterase [Verrucomicrobiales bacterium]|nr:acetylxylan esterase [Verrucomicrobiales bacterium]